MKKYLPALALLLVLSTAFSQNWTTITNITPRFSFALPNKPNIVDTLRVKYYYYKLDTVIGFQVHLIDSVQFANNNDIFNEALKQTKGDTLRAISKTMIAFSQAELTSIQNIDGSALFKGLEIGLKYKELICNRVAFSFIRFYRSHNEFISFTITGYGDDLDRLIYNKNLFFTSITF